MLNTGQFIVNDKSNKYNSLNSNKFVQSGNVPNAQNLQYQKQSSSKNNNSKNLNMSQYGGMSTYQKLSKIYSNPTMPSNSAQQQQ